jgi:hypothetical protein
VSIVALLEPFRRKGRLYLVFEYVQQNLLEVLEENSAGLAPDLVRTVRMEEGQMGGTKIWPAFLILTHTHTHTNTHTLSTFFNSVMPSPSATART